MLVLEPVLGWNITWPNMVLAVAVAAVAAAGRAGRPKRARKSTRANTTTELKKTGKSRKGL